MQCEMQRADCPRREDALRNLGVVLTHDGGGVVPAVCAAQCCRADEGLAGRIRAYLERGRGREGEKGETHCKTKA
jgi:hypothetical protein